MGQCVPVGLYMSIGICIHCEVFVYLKALLLDSCES